MRDSSEKWWARNDERLKERKETVLCLSVCLARLVGEDGGYALQCPMETQGLRFPVSAACCEILRT